ncbi:TetR/AcrR family transcriptional regulator [Halobacillus hunanensis]|uniref:TetR/AcrR family transcriptional regulator n=1 Tax=Halobacillus hunanensis TaxID=578214 RepID=UPI0009A7A3A5|nr:TetR/AcrR family transcriptional regulator [Halobacillus hunanensis]
MSNLRGRKKEKTREAILVSGKRLFVSKGYEKTTMKDIAHDCDIGVGTLYNYYESKSRLLQEIFRNNLPDLSSQVAKIQQDDSLSLPEKIHDIISLSMTVFHQFPRSFYRGLFSVMANETENSKEVSDKMLAIDEQFMFLMAKVLEREKETGHLSESYPVNRSVTLMYSILAAQIMVYLLDDSVSKEQVLSEITDQIYFLLELRGS